MSNQVDSPEGNAADVVVQGTHNYSREDRYIAPSNEQLQQKLEWFLDQKLGLMMHWGLYGELGMVASWALSDKDGDWSRHQVDWTHDMEEFKQQYHDLKYSFNPVRFQPEKWADMAKENGFRYLVLTTKHHDGFCLWDSQYTDFKTTSTDCPFHTHKHADIIQSMFDAFRERNLGIGAYFSKADWNSPHYWNKELSQGKPSSRGPSYNPSEHPEEWEKFVDFTRKQILELVEKYGKIDILWFDAGWVCERSGQDIRLGEIIEEARKHTPDILSVDRTIGGAYENYVTPEQCIPDEPLDIPWESCLTLGVDYTYEYDDNYKPARELVQLLVEIVAKGGNLILNVSPQPDGRIPVKALPILEEFGSWLKQYGEAIYDTRAVAPYQVGNTAFTQKGNHVYAIHLYPDGDESRASTLHIPYTEQIVSVVDMTSGEEISFQQDESGIRIELQQNSSNETLPFADVFVLKKA